MANPVSLGDARKLFSDLCDKLGLPERTKSLRIEYDFNDGLPTVTVTSVLIDGKELASIRELVEQYDLHPVKRETSARAESISDKCLMCGNGLNNISPGFGIVQGNPVCHPCMKKWGLVPTAIAR